MSNVETETIARTFVIRVRDKNNNTVYEEATKLTKKELLNDIKKSRENTYSYEKPYKVEYKHLWVTCSSASKEYVDCLTDNEEYQDYAYNEAEFREAAEEAGYTDYLFCGYSTSNLNHKRSLYFSDLEPRPTHLLELEVLERLPVNHKLYSYLNSKQIALANSIKEHDNDHRLVLFSGPIRLVESIISSLEISWKDTEDLKGLIKNAPNADGIYQVLLLIDLNDERNNKLSKRMNIKSDRMNINRQWRH